MKFMYMEVLSEPKKCMYGAGVQTRETNKGRSVSQRVYHWVREVHLLLLKLFYHLHSTSPVDRPRTPLNGL